MDKEFIHKELSESIIGSAMTVLNTLRPGLDEKLYENALVIERGSAATVWTKNERFQCTMTGN